MSYERKKDKRDVLSSNDNGISQQVYKEILRRLLRENATRNEKTREDARVVSGKAMAISPQCSCSQSPEHPQFLAEKNIFVLEQPP